MDDPDAVQSETTMVKWDDGTHEIQIYNNDNGYGLTACGERIGPWDIWLVGEITCPKCRRVRAEEHHSEKGPREWFPPKPDPTKKE